MGTLAGRSIVLGVTGGIAAYKAVEIASRLKKAGAEVRVVMTRAAASFVAPLTFREITGQAVATSMWTEIPAHHVEHIALAELADLVLVAPATANFIAKAAAGIADDLLTTTVLATRAPLYIAPAMNTGMWENPVTQENVMRLCERGAQVIPPAEGLLACGTTGAGRLPEPEEIVAAVERHFAAAEILAGRRIIVTAGGTEEALVQGEKDDVSYVDCLLDEVYGSINCAEVDREITPEQALYLRQKYLWGRSTPE